MTLSMNNNANADGGAPPERSKSKPNPFLSANHERMLFEESGIEPEVVKARGYRTVRRKVELEELGFGRTQRNVPALLIPVYSPRGEISTYQVRPDEPMIKDGVDDYFVAGHSLDDLLAHATQELREPPRDDENGEPAARYRATSQGLVWGKPTRYGISPTPLTNFTAEIVSDIVEDDGAEEKHTFEIEARLRERQRRFEVPASRFASMNWVAEHLGASAFVYPGFGYEKHAAVAIQSLSGEIAERRYFAHTGWRKIEGEWAYLHAGGAIGPIGPLTGVEVAMGDGRLGDCLLPEPPENTALVEAVRASLRFLDLAPPGVAYPLIAAVYRAALGEASPVDLSVHLVGPTGAHKTELTAIAQAHYGAAFNSRNLPGNWESTDNALEKQAFLLKDAG